MATTLDLANAPAGPLQPGGVIGPIFGGRGFMSRKSRLLAKEAERARAGLVTETADQWNAAIDAQRQAATNDNDRKQIDTLGYQGNIALKYMQSGHPELRKLGESMLPDLLKAQREYELTQESQRITADTQAQTVKNQIGEQRWNRFRQVADDSRAESAPFLEQRAAMGRVKAALANPDEAGDYALLYAVNKLLDPGSVVRESEFANAQNLAGVPDIIITARNKLREGERLSPEQRKSWYQMATNLYSQAQKEQAERNSRYLAQARAGDVPEEMVDSLVFPIDSPGKVPDFFGDVKPDAGKKAGAETAQAGKELGEQVGNLGGGFVRGLLGLDDTYKDAQGNVYKKVDRGQGRFEWQKIEDAPPPQEQQLPVRGVIQR